MEWEKYLENILTEEDLLEHMKVSFSGKKGAISIPNIIRASVSLLNDMLRRCGKNQIIVFPETEMLGMLFILSYLMNNIYTGKIQHDYDPHKFVEGEKLRVGKAIVEFVRLEVRGGKEYIALKSSENTTLISPLSSVPFLQKVDTERRLSPQKVFLTEKASLEKEMKEDKGGLRLFQNLNQYKTHMLSSIYCVTTLSDVKEKINTCYLNDKKLTESLLLSTVDYEGKIKNIGPGQATGIPAMVFASDLFAIDQLILEEKIPQSVLIDLSRISGIEGQLDCLDNLLELQIPIVCITDTINSFNFQALVERGFEIWRWDAQYISDQLIDDNDLTMTKKIKMCSKQEINFVNVDGIEISKVLTNIYMYSKETGNQSPQLMKIYARLCHMAYASVQRIAPFSESQLREVHENLLECARKLKQEKSYISKEMYEAFSNIIENLYRVYLDEKGMNKIYVLEKELKKYKRTKICIIIPERENKQEIMKYWDEWTHKYILLNRITFLTPREYYMSIPGQFDLAIIAGWINRTVMRKILLSFNTQKIVVLLYDQEEKWKNSCVRNWEYHKRKANNRTILNEIEGTMREDPKSTFLEEDEPSVELEEDEQSSVDYVLRENNFKRYVSNQKDSVEAIPVNFVGGYVSFYRMGHELIKATGIITGKSDKISLVRPMDVKEGDFIVVCETDRDIIRKLADLVLEKNDKGDARKVATSWRESINIALACHMTVDKICGEIKKQGCTKELQTIKKWIVDSEIIAPQQKEDLKIIAKVTKSEVLKEKAEEIFEAAQLVKKAHIKAGNILAEQLKEKLSNELMKYDSIDPYNVWQPMEIYVEDIGKIKILKIIDVGNSIQVNSCDTDRLIMEE